jgi:hypothetical protein
VKALDTTIIRNTIRKLEQLDRFVKDDLDDIIRDAEITGFFFLRHQNMPYAAKLQQVIIKNWEPRVAGLLSTLDKNGWIPSKRLLAYAPSKLTMPEYEKLRAWLGMDKCDLSKWFQTEKENKLADVSFQARAHWDLRDEAPEDINDSIYEDEDYY